MCTLPKNKWSQSKLYQPAEYATFIAANSMTWLGSATCGTDKINDHGAMGPLLYVYNFLNRSPDGGPELATKTGNPSRHCKRWQKDLAGVTSRAH